MNVVFDTNIVIDAVAARKPFCKEAEEILIMAAENRITAWLTANSVTDIFYVVRRSLPEPKTREIIRSLIYSLEVINVGGEDCWQALNLRMGDFEDALVAVCAMKINADYIVSRDKAFLEAASQVQVITPSEFLLTVKD